jgi:hypothetical protein
LRSVCSRSPARLASLKVSKLPVCTSDLQGEYLGDYDRQFMKKFRVPAGVKHLIIFADRDETALRVWLLPANALTQIWWLKMTCSA